MKYVIKHSLPFFFFPLRYPFCMRSQGKLVSNFFVFWDSAECFSPRLQLPSFFRVLSVLEVYLVSSITWEIFGNTKLWLFAPDVLIHWGEAGLGYIQFLKNSWFCTKLYFEKWFCCIVRVENSLCRQDTIRIFLLTWGKKQQAKPLEAVASSRQLHFLFFLV